MGRVQDKVALVTGGASGIGLATAELLAAEGARVVIGDVDRAAGERAAAAIGPRAIVHQLDVTREDDWIAVTDRVTADVGRLDILVNNAGVVLMKSIEETTLEEWRSLMAVNLDGVFLGCKHAVRVMKERGGGAIVNMSSTAGLEAVGGLAGYVSAKHGVIGLTKTAALDYATQGIRVNALAPGPILTENLERAGPEMQERAGQALPMRRIGRTDEVARAVVWLCSDDASFTTGATIPVEGGKLAGIAPFNAPGRDASG